MSFYLWFRWKSKWWNKKVKWKRNGANTYCATFSGKKVKFDKKLFAGADLTAVFGGVENKSNTSGEENTHTIYVNGTAIFGGVEIKWHQSKK